MINGGGNEASAVEFLLNTRLFTSIPDKSIAPLLNNLEFKQVKAGERFITQGDDGDRFYIIQLRVVHVEDIS